jgi:2-polyprenyl-6-methoxyphenol hydroxylase-like FAD-dependent oxidoreductase
MPTDFSIRPTFSFPTNPALIEDNRLPLIVIGDALHALPPWSGSSGNNALQDAADLSKVLLQELPELDRAQLVKEFRRLEEKFLKNAEDGEEQRLFTEKIIKECH